MDCELIFFFGNGGKCSLWPGHLLGQAVGERGHAGVALCPSQPSLIYRLCQPQCLGCGKRQSDVWGIPMGLSA